MVDAALKPAMMHKIFLLLAEEDSCRLLDI
jgi:hypothetical protein